MSPAFDSYSDAPTIAVPFSPSISFMKMVTQGPSFTAPYNGTTLGLVIAAHVVNSSARKCSTCTWSDKETPNKFYDTSWQTCPSPVPASESPALPSSGNSQTAFGFRNRWVQELSGNTQINSEQGQRESLNPQCPSEDLSKQIKK